MRLLRGWTTVSSVVGLVLLAMVAFGLVFGTLTAEQTALRAVVIALLVWGSNLVVRRVLEHVDTDWEAADGVSDPARGRDANRPSAATGNDDSERAA